MNKKLAETFSTDSTQTIRALTQAELRDLNQPRWYIIQIVTSNQPINLDTMPRLDVFTAYRLYTVIGQHGRSQCYALRLGFFADETSARDICGYLQDYFASPRVVRVSAAEQSRFGDPQPRSAPPAAQKQGVNIVQIAASRDAPTRAASVAPVPTKSSISGGSANANAASRNERAEQPAAASGRIDNKRSAPTAKSPAGAGKKGKTLGQELMEEARQVQLAKSGKHRIQQQPKQSWLSRLFGSKG